MKIKRKYWFIRCFLFVSVILLYTSIKSSAAEVQKIKVGYFDYYGFLNKQIDGSFTGYGAEYLKEIAKYTGWEYQYVYGTWTECLEMLKKGEIDLLCTAQYSEERAKYYQYCKYETGVEYATLYAAKDNDTIYYEDYEAFQGMRVGMLKGSYQNELFEEYKVKHNLKIKQVYYETTAAMTNALYGGELDAIVNGSLNLSKTEKLIAKFGVSPFYFITGKKNDNLMKTLNQVMGEIRDEKPFFNTDLYKKYYGIPSRTLVGITRQEAEYIKNCDTLTVACNYNAYPIEYIDSKTGVYSGIYGDIWKMIEKNSGLQFRYLKTDSYEESWEMIKNKEVDLISSVYGNQENAKNYSLFFTNEYYIEDCSFIGKRGKKVDTEEDLSIAIPSDCIGMQYYLQEYFPKWTIFTYPSVEDCLNAVNREKADITMINSIFLQTVINLKHYNNLFILSALETNIPISIGISQEEDLVLQSILNKGIGQISSQDVRQIVTKNTINIFYHPTLLEMMHQYSWVIFVIVFFFAISIIIVIRQRELHYKRLAMIDRLTKIWNGSKFKEEAEYLINHNKNKSYFLCSIDIDKFKHINDQYSTKFGDMVLKEIAKMLEDLFQNEGFYARGVADRFYVLVEEKEPALWKEKIQENIKLNLEKRDKKQLYVPIKSGIYIIQPRTKAVSITECIDKANIAKGTIKGNHNKNVAYYNAELEKKIAIENEIERTMVEALACHEFVVYYQPKYRLLNTQLIGAEALVRWQSKTRGLISPIEFIPLFERNGFIISLDFYVYEEVMKNMHEWMESGKDVIPIAINVSRIHFTSPDFIEKLMGLIEKYQIPTEMIEMEVTESALGEGTEIILDFLNEIKRLNFKISIDDFGTGYSSLNLLKEMPVDILKIDKEFLKETEDSERSRIIIEQVVEMARKIHISTICEGVETKKQEEFLRNIGCNMVQGYLYAKPMQKEEFEKMF